MLRKAQNDCHSLCDSYQDLTSTLSYLQYLHTSTLKAIDTLLLISESASSLESQGLKYMTSKLAVVYFAQHMYVHGVYCTFLFLSLVQWNNAIKNTDITNIRLQCPWFLIFCAHWENAVQCTTTVNYWHH